MNLDIDVICFPVILFRKIETEGGIVFLTKVSFYRRKEMITVIVLMVKIDVQIYSGPNFGL